MESSGRGVCLPIRELESGRCELVALTFSTCDVEGSGAIGSGAAHVYQYDATLSFFSIHSQRQD
jgi:hypothetical protein